MIKVIKMTPITVHQQRLSAYARTRGEVWVRGHIPPLPETDRHAHSSPKNR